MDSDFGWACGCSPYFRHRLGKDSPFNSNELNGPRIRDTLGMIPPTCVPSPVPSPTATFDRKPSFAVARTTRRATGRLSLTWTRRARADEGAGDARLNVAGKTLGVEVGAVEVQRMACVDDSTSPRRPLWWLRFLYPWLPCVSWPWDMWYASHTVTSVTPWFP